MTETWIENIPIILNGRSSDIPDIKTDLEYLYNRLGYRVDPSETDQGSAGTGQSIKDYVDSIGSSKQAVLFLPHHSRDGNTTTYTLTTSETIPSNIDLFLEPGAILDGAGTLTFEGGSLIANDAQKIFGTSITIDGHIGNTYVVSEWWGAIADGSTNSTTAIQSAITFAEQNNPDNTYNFGSLLQFLAGQYNITSALTTTSGKAVNIRGMGPKATVIYQATDNTDILQIHNSTLKNVGGSITDIRFQGLTDTTGTAISLRNVGDSFQINNVECFEIGTGIKIDGCWYVKISDIAIQYYHDHGIYIPTSTTAFGGGTMVANAKINNSGFAGDGTAAIGIRIRESGGEIFQAIDITEAYRGIVIDPATSDVVAYLFFDSVLADGSFSENIYIDGTNGEVSSIHFDNCWASYSQGASEDFSDGADGVKILGGNVEGISFDNCRIRENAKHGINITAGEEIRITNCTIATNSQMTDDTYHGIDIAANIDEFIISGCRIGNLVSGLTNTQKHAINIAAGDSDQFLIQNNDLTQAGSGGKAVNIGALSTFQYRITNNLTNESNSVVSAATITLPHVGKFFNITGITNCTSGITASWSDREIILKFVSTPTLTDYSGGSNVLLSGAANFSATANDVLHLICDGTYWHEISRSIN